MLIQSYENGEFAVIKGIPCYKGTRLCAEPPKPLFVAGGCDVYFFVMPHEANFKYLVIVQDRYPSFYACKGVDFGENGLTTKRFTLHLIDGQTKIFREEDAGGYPHEDMSGTRLITW